jgi:hypothetical protein
VELLKKGVVKLLNNTGQDSLDFRFTLRYLGDKIVLELYLE